MASSSSTFDKDIKSMEDYVTTLRKESLDKDVQYNADELLQSLSEIKNHPHSPEIQEQVEECYRLIFALMEQPEVVNKYL